MHNAIIRLFSKDSHEACMITWGLLQFHFYCIVCVTFFRLSNNIMRYHYNYVSLMPGRAHHCSGDSTEEENCAQGIELWPMAFSDLFSVFCYQNLEHDNLESSELKTLLLQMIIFMLCHWGGLVGSANKPHSLFFSLWLMWPGKSTKHMQF